MYCYNTMPRINSSSSLSTQFLLLVVAIGAYLYSSEAFVSHSVARKRSVVGSLPIRSLCVERRSIRCNPGTRSSNNSNRKLLSVRLTTTTQSNDREGEPDDVKGLKRNLTKEFLAIGCPAFIQVGSWHLPSSYSFGNDASIQ